MKKPKAFGGNFGVLNKGELFAINSDSHFLGDEANDDN